MLNSSHTPSSGKAGDVLEGLELGSVGMGYITIQTTDGLGSTSNDKLTQIGARSAQAQSEFELDLV